jgi:hypothetical protein
MCMRLACEGAGVAEPQFTCDTFFVASFKRMLLRAFFRLRYCHTARVSLI